METKNLFINNNYNEKDYKNCISKYLKEHVGFIVDENDISFLKIDIDDIDSYIVILKDDIRRISKKKGGSGVLRQRQWSIFVFNFISYYSYEFYFGRNKNNKSIVSPYKQDNMDTFTYQQNSIKYKGNSPEKLYRSASIDYLLHNYIYLKLREDYRYLFLNSYVYSVIGVINPQPLFFSTYYYNTNHTFKPVLDSKRIINQKADINKTMSLIKNVESELESIERSYGDMSSLVDAYLGNLEMSPITSENYNEIDNDIKNHVNYIITEGTARTGKTVIAMRLLGNFKKSRLVIMNYQFYNSLETIFKIEKIDFPNDKIICHTKFDTMSKWTSDSEILIVDEAQRLSETQIDNILNNEKNINILLGDNSQAINKDYDEGIIAIEEKLKKKKINYKKYYFTHSIGIPTNLLYSIKYLIYHDVFNNQNINKFDINIFNDENEFATKYKEDRTYRKHMATIYMSCGDYNETIKGFDRWHANNIRNYPYFLDNDIKSKVMITTYELISRELDSVYVYIPDSVHADKNGLHYSQSYLDKYLLNQLYVLLTRAKGEINIYCANSSAYEYLNQRNKNILRNDRIISTLSQKEQQKSEDLENKIKQRGITRLIHFTPKDNVESIKKYGIMSVKTLKEKNIQYKFNDEKRLDNILDGISLTIENPNNYLLYSYKFRNYGRNYVCLILDTSLLYEITNKSGEKLASREYFDRNAASSIAQHSPDNIDIMFENFKRGSWFNSKDEFDARDGKEDNETTDIQAEIMFRETIDPKYILEIKDI